MFPFPKTLTSSFLLAAFAQGALAELATFSSPLSVTGDADGNLTAPWESDGVAELSLQFDTADSIPDGSNINSVSLQCAGTAISPSYRSEVDITISDPSGNTFG